MSKFLKILIKVAAYFTLAALVFIILYISVNGIPNLKLSLFAPKYTTENVSMLPSLIVTLVVVVLTLLVAVPIGVASAIYLSEYSKKGSKIVKIIRLGTESLAGIPSIIYGLFGMIFFVYELQMQYSIMACVLTAIIMVLPIIIRTSEEAILAVPDSFRKASFGLGAGKLSTIFKVVLPPAMNGILAGIILSIGRIVGETAAFIYTLGTATAMPKALNESGRTLALHMYVLSDEGFHVEASFATAFVLLIVVVIINMLSTKLSRKVMK